MVLRKGKWALRVKRCRRVCFRRATSSASKRARKSQRSEEHTSELQSQSNLVCRLLLEKKNRRGIVIQSVALTDTTPAAPRFVITVPKKLSSTLDFQDAILQNNLASQKIRRALKFPRRD